jgi:hypothetical protein
MRALEQIIAEHPFCKGLNPLYFHLLNEYASDMRFEAEQQIFQRDRMPITSISSTQDESRWRRLRLARASSRFRRLWRGKRFPRGSLYHRYRIDDDGIILDAKIVPPTSQNQKTIESDLWRFVLSRIDLPNDKLTWQCEQAIRNHDPCISCATHFLNLKVERG